MNQLTQMKQFNIEEIQKLSKELFTSALFDSKNPSQIFAKILAGKELGLEPVASITGINIIQGKPCLGANLIATLIARHPHYDYRVLISDDTICKIEIFENNNSLGICSFTMQEAQKAGLIGKDNWKKYPSDMLFARCITRAARRFAPGIFGGSPIYTPEELGADMDEEGRIIDGEVIKDMPRKKIKSKKYHEENVEIEESATEDQISTIRLLSTELQKGGDYISKLLMSRFGHEDFTKVSKKFMDGWIGKLQKQSTEKEQFISEMEDNNINKEEQIIQTEEEKEPFI